MFALAVILGSNAAVFGTVGAVSSSDDSNYITAFTISGQIDETVIEANTIALTMPSDTDLSSLTPAITHTGASINPASGVAQNFTGPVTYTVTALNGNTRSYTVTVSLQPICTGSSGCNAGAGNITFSVLALVVVFLTNRLPGIRKKK